MVVLAVVTVPRPVRVGLRRMVKKLKRVEIAYPAAFHRLTSNGLLRLKNSAYNLAFTGV
jgi:hypothetical protein